MSDRVGVVWIFKKRQYPGVAPKNLAGKSHVGNSKTSKVIGTE
jgi:hypothetical protein